MKRHTSYLCFLLLLGTFSEVHAQSTVLYDISTPIQPDGNVQNTPGQTYDFAAATVQSGGVTSLMGAINCGMYSASVCTGAAGPAVLTSGASTPAGLPGLTVSYAQSAFNNSVSTSLTVTGSTAAVASNSVMFVGGGELQQLQINYSGAEPAPTSVGIDITSTVSASVTDNSVGNSSHVTETYAVVEVLDPTTLSAAVDATGHNEITALYQAGAQAGSLSAGPDSASLVDQTNQISLATGHPYWVFLSTTAEALLTTGSDNLSLAFNDSADPTFVVDPTWLKENPEYAGQISISDNYGGASAAQAPELDPGSLEGGITLLAGVIMLLGGRRRLSRV